MIKKLVPMLLLLSSIAVGEEYMAGNGHLPDERSVSDVFFVGAHNSAMSKKEGWLYYQQEVSLENQWRRYDVRAFKVPMHYFSPANTGSGNIQEFFGVDGGGPYIALAHENDGRTNCQLTRLQRGLRNPTPAVDWLARLRKLLEEDDQEVAILMIESYLDKMSEANRMIGREQEQAALVQELLEEAGLLPYVYHLGSYYRDHPFPTLGELRQSGKRLMIVSSDYKDQLDNVSLYRESIFETPYDYLTGDGPIKMRGEGRDRLGRSHFFLLNHFVEVSLPHDDFTKEAAAKIAKQLLPSHIAGRIVTTNYHKLNSYEVLMQHVLCAAHSQNLPPNILLIDFVNKGDNGGAQRVVHELNHLELLPF